MEVKLHDLCLQHTKMILAFSLSAAGADSKAFSSYSQPSRELCLMSIQTQDSHHLFYTPKFHRGRKHMLECQKYVPGALVYTCV